MKKIVVLSFLCFLTLNSCIIQKRYHLKGFQISKLGASKKVKTSAKKENTTLNFVEKASVKTELVHSKTINQESRNVITTSVSSEYQPELPETNGKAVISLHSAIALDNKTHRINDISQVGSTKSALVIDDSQLKKTEFKQRSTPKSIHQQKITPAKMPLWKQAVIALSVLVVLIGLYIALVFSEIFAFGN
jgi:preprotein translocase subunit SecF